MTIGEPDQGVGPLFPAAPPRKRRRSVAPAILAAVAVIALLGGGGWLMFKHRSAGADWVLPDGVASMSEVERCLREHEMPCAEADLLAYMAKYPTDSHAVALLAITLTQDGRHKESLYYYWKAEHMGVATYDFDAGYAKSLDATGDVGKAILKNQAALSLQPRLVDVRGALADELVKKGRGKEALDLLDGFDRQLESEGYPAYFAAQVRQIKLGLGGDYAKEVAQDTGATLAAAPGQTLVRGEVHSGTLAVPVSVDGAQPMSFMVDSGASVVTLPDDDAAPFLKLGLIKPGDYRGARMTQLANGALVMAQIYNLHSVKVGDREVHDVMAAVYHGHGPRLLGQSFLKRFKSWSVDNGRRVLTLTD